MSRLIDANRLLTDRMKSKYYHLPNGDIAIPLIDIEHAPTIEPEQRWIPCDMQLPEKSQLCLVTEKTVVGFEVCTRYFNKRDDGGFWSGWGHTEVIAWRRLPEPYREEGD